MIDDAHDRVRDMVMNGYLSNIDRLTSNRLIGALISKCLNNNQFLIDTKFQAELKEIFLDSADEAKDKKEFLNKLLEEISKKVNPDENEKPEEHDNSLNADRALANFVKIVCY